MIVTYKYRIKDSRSARHLERYAFGANQIWNFCVSTQREVERRRKGGASGLWPSAFDLVKLCNGAAAELGIHSDTTRAVCRRFVSARDEIKECPGFRASGGPKRSLGWVPFRARAVKIADGRAVYLGRTFRFWNSRETEGTYKSGVFTQDARSRWYLCLQFEIDEQRQTGVGQIGIDLGLKILASCSDGTTVPALQHSRKYEAAIAVAQRSRNKPRMRAIHAKVANVRRHHMHGWSTQVARDNALIVVGNISGANLAKTRMAKSVFDASWGLLRSQLAYKASRHGARYIEVSERFTSQTCSHCGIIPDSSPKGMGALGIRHWDCSGCGASHDRDVNAAKNILRAGLEHQPPVEEICTLGEDVKSAYDL